MLNRRCVETLSDLIPRGDREPSNWGLLPQYGLFTCCIEGLWSVWERDESIMLK